MTTIGVPISLQPPIQPPTRFMPLYSYPRIVYCESKHFQNLRTQTAPVKLVPIVRKQNLSFENIGQVNISETASAYQSYKQLVPHLTQTERSVTSLDLRAIRNQHLREYGSKNVLTNASMYMTDFLNRCPERYKFSLNVPPKYLIDEGYEMRYLRPDITKHVKYPPVTESKLSPYINMPRDVASSACYRTTKAEDESLYSPSKPWKP